MKTTYRSQCARDAQAMNYGDKGYWDYLESSSLEHYAKRDRFPELSDALTRSLSEALRGNEGI
jgi:hypothetical protein